jgi:response regulator RpfG family c-di-GMP phosphodiesterase
MVGKIKILYVDDEENNLFSFKATFRMKYDVYTAISAADAKEILKQHSDIALIITDQRMPNMTGVEFLESILDEYPDPIRVLLTGYADINAVIEAVNKGKIFHYLSKPWNEEELEMTIERGYAIYDEKMKEKEMNKNLIRTNDQLEFLLRQKLIS